MMLVLDGWRGFDLVGKAIELARSVGGGVSAVVLDSVEAAEAVSGCGVDRVVVVGGEGYDPAAYGDTIVDVVSRLKPGTVIFSATSRGRELAPYVAARLDTGYIADISDIAVEDGDLVFVRPMVGGLYSVIRSLKLPRIVSVRPGTFPPPSECSSARRPTVERVEVRGVRTRLVSSRRVSEPVRDSDIVVVAGRGVGGRDGVTRVMELARELSASFGATLPVVLMGWADSRYLIGVSGRVVRPRIYIGIGVGGAPQHMAGVRDPEVVISVNIDPNAPIRKYSDYLIAVDWRDFVDKVLLLLRELSK